MSKRVVWVFEPGMFTDTRPSYDEAVHSLEHVAEDFLPDWWENGRWPRHDDDVVLFRGSLGDADRICRELPWKPGAFCNTAGFACSSWYPGAARWLVHNYWTKTSVSDLVERPDEILTGIGSPERFFVRPDSPLKPFSGRVLNRAELSLEALDYGYYYDNADLPIILAPVQNVGREWRYVVVEGKVVAGSAYDPNGRVARPDDPSGTPWRSAEDVAAQITAPDPVYVLDVCELGGALRLLELNPFSGADLYACNAAAVVDAVSQAALVMTGKGP